MYQMYLVLNLYIYKYISYVAVWSMLIRHQLTGNKTGEEIFVLWAHWRLDDFSISICV